ncbi:hypothetical protein IAU60_001285 [Kwoniella sp. DSM 27419]
MAPYVPIHDRPPHYSDLPTPPRSGQGNGTPRYGSPDIDPTVPYRQGREGRDVMSSRYSAERDAYAQEHQHDETNDRIGAVNGVESYVPRRRAEPAVEDESEAGPSRKRAREDHQGHQGDHDRRDDPGYHHDQAGGRRSYVPQQVQLTGSIFNISPRNPFTAVVGDFILANASGLDNVEIEIKLGTLMSADHGGPPRRIRMPTQSETIMPSDFPLGPFHSTMHPYQYKVFNNLLNQAVQTSQSLPSSQGKVHFSRSKLNDSFYGSGGRGGKIRVSRDRETGQIIPGGVITKRRVADLNVYCPNMPFDWRISINVEQPCEMPGGGPTLTRDKDRACYTHQVCQVDLTHVMSKPLDNPTAKPTSTFEIEIEIRDVPTLIAEGQAGSDRFDEILQNVLDTARMLIKNSEHAPQ